MIKDYVCVDIETTGCQSKWNKIIEIGAVKVKDGKVVETFSKLVNPGVKIPDFITTLTGITNEMVKDEQGIEAVMPEFVRFSEDYVLLGHNLRFDYSFLKQNAENLNIDFDKEGIDTLKIARKVHKELESRKLQYLCEYYGIADEHHHRAYNDADVTSQLYMILLDKFYEEYPEVFEPQKMEMSVKKLQPITPRQIKYLTNLCNYHNVSIDFEIEKLSKNEASRKIDKILSEKGRILY